MRWLGCCKLWAPSWISVTLSWVWPYLRWATAWATWLQTLLLQRWDSLPWQFRPATQALCWVCEGFSNFMRWSNSGIDMVLGVGISSAYQAFKTGHPYELDIAPSILVSCSGLITVLLSTLVVVNLNGYVINKGLGWWMIIVYSTCCLINVLLECDVFKR